jgi:hypothetical protein
MYLRPLTLDLSSMQIIFYVYVFLLFIFLNDQLIVPSQSFINRLLLHEDSLMKKAHPSTRRLRRLMKWEPSDDDGGYSAMDSTRDHVLSFLCAYRLLDVLSLYDARVASQTSFKIQRNPRLPTLAASRYIDVRTHCWLVIN